MATSSLRVGVMPGADPEGVVRSLVHVRRTHHGVDVLTRQCWGSVDDLARLGSGEVDVLVLVGPVETEDLGPELVATPFARRDRCAVLAADHPLADLPTLRLEDVLGQPTFARPEAVLPTWRSYWLNVAERGGEPRYIGRSTTELDALLAIGSSRVVGIAPEGWGRAPGLTARRVEGLDPVPVVVLTRPDEGPGAVATFVATLRDRSYATLTPAETRVASLVAEGLSDREIADRLVLSPRTVETQVASARRRLDLRSRAHLAAYATRRGLPW